MYLSFVPATVSVPYVLFVVASRKLELHGTWLNKTKLVGNCLL